MPDYANGKICYVEIPASDIAKSSEFYRKTFGWKIRTRENGTVSFDDTVGQVSGAWVLGRSPTTPQDNARLGLIIHIMVDDMTASIDAVKRNGGEIVQPVGADHPEITARFRDPGGNILGMYQHRGG